MAYLVARKYFFKVLSKQSLKPALLLFQTANISMMLFFIIIIIYDIPILSPDDTGVEPYHKAQLLS